MFDSIAPRYDFLNHFLSLGIDKRWRKRLVKRLIKNNPKDVLDVATGTGDLAIAIAKAGVPHVTGVDISEQMLVEGKRKVEQLKLSAKVSMSYGNSEQLGFADQSFDVVSVAFGVRNFEHLEVGLAEMHRVLRSGGQVFVLEFSMPANALVKAFYRFYFFKILPLIGRCVSKSKGAYSYLPHSVDAFPHGDRFLNKLKEVGFVKTYRLPLSFGIAELYIGTK